MDGSLNFEILRGGWGAQVVFEIQVEGRGGQETVPSVGKGCGFFLEL